MMTQHAGADTLTVGSVVTWVMAHIVDINNVVQVIAGILTAVAALISIVVRFRKKK